MLAVRDRDTGNSHVAPRGAAKGQLPSIMVAYSSETREFLGLFGAIEGTGWGLLDPDAHPIGNGTYNRHART